MNKCTFFLIFSIFICPVFAQDIALTDTDNIAEAEFHTAINPTDESNIVVATMHGFSGFNDSYFDIYYTLDFGKTWQLSDFKGFYPGDAGTGDPVLSFDADGNLFLVHLIATDVFDVFTTLSRSKDKGATWEKVYTYPDPFTDKPWMTIDRNPTSPNFGNIYLVDVTSDGVLLITLDSEFNLLHSTVMTDVNQLPSVVVANDGEIFASGMNWTSDPLDFHAYHFTDAGQTILNSNIVASTPDFTFNVGDISNRFQNSPQLAIDNSNSDYAGRIYFTLTQSESDGQRFFDVIQRYSDDQGLTWSDAKAVHSNLDFHVQQYYPSSFVNSDGVVLVDWYDRKNHGEGSAITDFFLGISYDGGETYSEYKLNSSSMDFNIASQAGFSFGIGEYHQLVATQDTVVSFWSDGRKNDGDLNIFYAKVDLNNPISGVQESGLLQDKISISKIYPQPVKGILNIDLQLKKEYAFKYQILDMNGRLIQDSPFQDYSAGKHSLAIPNTLSSGSYILKLSTDTGYFKTMQFIKQD